MAIIRKTTVVLQLAVALALYPGAGIVVYHRLSGSRGAGKTNLRKNTQAVVDAVRKLAPGRPIVDFTDTEKGKLSKPRSKLIEACQYAKQHGWIVVAWDVSRFIRPESYCRRTNSEATLTAEELAELVKITGGVILATVVDPDATEAQRQSLAIKRNGDCGRPSSLDDAKRLRILEGRGDFLWNRWEMSLRELADELGVDLGVVRRWLDTEVPEEAGVPKGMRWRDLPNRVRVFRELCAKRGRPLPPRNPPLANTEKRRWSGTLIEPQ
jgi:hypothetical protein